MTADNTLDGEERDAQEQTSARARARSEAERVRQHPHPIGQPRATVKLTPEDNFQFRCHRGVSCWNKCCHGADITLPPYDILRLSRHFGLRPAEFLERYTVPAEHEAAGMPVVKLKMGGDDGKGACPFLADEGCKVYADRPRRLPVLSARPDFGEAQGQRSQGGFQFPRARAALPWARGDSIRRRLPNSPRIRALSLTSRSTAAGSTS